MKFGWAFTVLTAILSAWQPTPSTAQEATSRPCNSCCVDLSGTWDCGTWRSSTNGHSGRLRARLTRTGPNRYRCVFCGTFLKVVPFRYPVTLHVTCDDGQCVRFTASRRLPFFGGNFTCTGTATNCRFRASYSSPNDCGMFVMSR